MKQLLSKIKSQSITKSLSITNWKISSVDASKDEVFSGKAAFQDFSGPEWGTVPGTYWFKAVISVPEVGAGEEVSLNIAMHADAFPECHEKYPWTVGLTMHFEGLVYLNGKAWHGLDPNRSKVILPREVYGSDIEILIEAFTRSSYAKEMQSEVIVENTEFRDVYYDLLSLQELTSAAGNKEVTIDPLQLKNSGQSAELWDYSELEESLENLGRQVEKLDVSEIREFLQEKYKTITHPIADQSISLVGHCHIDSVWLWTLSETRRKIGRTFSAILRHMDKYPDFTFIQSSPFLFEWCEKDYPEIFAEVKKRTAEGRWEPEGGMYVEADCNMISGESIARQFLYGQKYFETTFGRRSKTLWLPDVFGFTGALPQLMAQAGLQVFCTNKVRQVKGKPNPYCSYWWEGIDGTKVKAHFQTSYINWGAPAQMFNHAERNVKLESLPYNILPYGFGDGGGGAVDDDIELASRWMDLPFFPEVKFENAGDFFDKLDPLYEKEKDKIPTFKGEQYIAYHLGTYTSIAEVKYWNRKGEILLCNAGLLSALADKYAALPYEKEKLEDAWKKTLYLQFHDILPGSSIKEVYDESREVFNDVEEATSALSSSSFEALAGSDEDSVFNKLGFACDAFVEVPQGSADSQEISYPDGTVKNMSYIKNLSPWASSPCAAEKTEGSFVWKDNKLTTPFWQVEFNERGELASLINGENLQFASGNLNVLKTFIDEPKSLDPWEVDDELYDKEIELFNYINLEVKAEGPIFFILRRTLRGENSELQQDIIFNCFNDRIDFVTSTDWHEKRKLLKACFELDIKAEYSRSETSFGWHARPTDKEKRKEEEWADTPMHRWAELSENGKGIAILNDCKYGFDAYENNLNITLLKSAGFAEVNINPGVGPLASPEKPRFWADQGRHNFTYSLISHSGDLSDGKVIREAMILNNPPQYLGCKLNIDSLINIDKPNVIADSLKKSEDGSGYVIRIYEAAGSDTTVEINFSEEVKGSFCNILEEDHRGSFTGKSATTRFKPFEVKSIYIQ
ncbi:MAG: alpha-mannosidase [Planctomycetota bacterium]|jgi:alpha-mannosidase